MPASYNVQVEAISGKEISLLATIISIEETDFFRDSSFGLMLLFDSTHSSRFESVELRRRIPEEQMLNPAWLATESGKYIKSIMISDWKNFPPKPSQFAEPLRLENLPQAVIEIIVSDPILISHLNVGDHWESSAFDIQGYL